MLSTVLCAGTGLPYTHPVLDWLTLHCEEAPLTSNEDRLEDGLLHRTAGNQVSIVQHISREALQPVPHCWAQCGHSMLQTLIGSLWQISLHSDVKQSRCSGTGHLLLGPDQTLMQSAF